MALRLAPWLAPTTLCFVSALSFGACGGDPQIVGDSDSNSDSDSAGDSDSDSAGDNDSGNDSGDIGDIDAGGGGGSDGGNGPVCETASNEAELQPIFLAFVFDVSGSMGQMDKPRWWHDKAKKWDPVVAATSSFFEDETSEGISASMALFPAENDLCLATSYEEPGVAMQELPSTAFEAHLDDYIATDAWRGNTPTRYALEGAGTYLNEVRTANGALEAKYAIVLVTDGEPAGCSNNAVSNSQTIAEGLLADEIPTYVIGVLNPTDKPAASDPVPTEWGDEDPWDHWGCNADGSSNGNGDFPCNAPNALSGLNSIAASGGTTAAVLVNTNDTNQAKEDLRAAIDAIRAQQLSCNVGIPPNPQGGTFNKDRINVSVTIEGTKTDFAYDPDCEGDDSWHYDDANDPQEIVLCESTCLELQSTPGAQLNVDFLCVDRPDVTR